MELQGQPTSDARPVGIRDLALGATMIAGAVAITWDAWKDILRLGQADEELSYVLLAPLVIVWLAVGRIGLARRLPVRGAWVGCLILLLGWGTFWYGYVSDPVIWRAGAVVIAVGAFVSAMGWPVAKVFAAALGACVFLIPVSPYGRYHVAVPLQNATAAVTQSVCDVIGMNVDRAGNLISINGVDVTVAEACNGMRMVLTLFMMCYVVAFTWDFRPIVRVLLILSSPLVAIVANVIRLVPTVWMFGNTSIQTAERFHAASGWVMTGVAFVALLLMSRGLQKLLSRSEPTETPHVAAMAT